MAMIKLEISPFDVLFFGDGKPFNMGGTAKSMALPMPHTVAGAITSKLKALYPGRKNLNTSIAAIYGPFLQKGEELYLPKPANVLQGRKGKGGHYLSLPKPKGTFKLLSAENTNVQGVETLPFYIGKEQVEGGGGFISLEDLKKLLPFEKHRSGKLKDLNVKGIEELVMDEPRVGISIGEDGTVGEDGLYRVWFKRLAKDVKVVVWVEFNDTELESLIPERDVLKLGGESRVAHYVSSEGNFLSHFEGFPRCRAGQVECNLMFLTPGILESWNPFGKVYSAAVPGYTTVPINVSYNDLEHTVVRAIPPGSVFWRVKLHLKRESNVGFLFKKKGDIRLVQRFEDFEPFIGANLVIVWPYERKGG